MMRFILSAVALVAAFAAWGKTLEGKVTRVSDGDTIWVTAGGKRVKVRMDRIDAPESNQEYGKESTEYLKRRIHGKTVKVEWGKTDQYGRTLGIVFLDGASPLVAEQTAGRLAQPHSATQTSPPYSNRCVTGSVSSFAEDITYS